jgi:two-component system response regulator DesR
MGRILLVAHHPKLRDALAMTITAQSRRALDVAAALSWEEATPAAVEAARPDVIVLIAGLDAGSELRALEPIRAAAPGCRLLVVDTLGDASDWQAGAWGQADALLHSEQLATDLVPAIQRLIAQIDAPDPGPDDEQPKPKDGPQ